jgi:hypothetical protein
MLRFISILLFAVCIHLGYANEYAGEYHEECRNSEPHMMVVRPDGLLYNDARASRKSSRLCLILSLDIQLYPSYIQVTYASTTDLLLSLTQGRKPKLRKPSQLEWVKT